MTIEIRKNVEETVLEIAGRLDTNTAPALDKTINEDIKETINLIFYLTYYNFAITLATHL